MVLVCGLANDGSAVDVDPEAARLAERLENDNLAGAERLVVPRAEKFRNELALESTAEEHASLIHRRNADAGHVAGDGERKVCPAHTRLQPGSGEGDGSVSLRSAGTDGGQFHRRLNAARAHHGIDAIQRLVAVETRVLTNPVPDAQFVEGHALARQTMVRQSIRDALDHIVAGSAPNPRAEDFHSAVGQGGGLGIRVFRAGHHAEGKQLRQPELLSTVRFTGGGRHGEEADVGLGQHENDRNGRVPRDDGRADGLLQGPVLHDGAVPRGVDHVVGVRKDDGVPVFPGELLANTVLTQISHVRAPGRLNAHPNRCCCVVAARPTRTGYVELKNSQACFLYHLNGECQHYFGPR